MLEGISFFSRPVATSHVVSFSGISPEWGASHHTGSLLSFGITSSLSGREVERIWSTADQSGVDFWEGRGEIETKFGNV